MELSHSKSDSFKIFDNIASKYDFINSVLSFGLHGVWRRRLAWMMPRTTNMKVLDLATGTADVAIELVNNENVTHVDGLDMSKGMVEVGREKLASLGLDNKIKLHIGDAQERGEYTQALRKFFIDHKSGLDSEALRRLETNPLRILDSKNPSLQSILDKAPLLADFVSDKSKDHFDLSLIHISEPTRPY